MTSSKRLRIFAGPNGSGKSSVIKFIQDYTTSEKHLDFGIYINADDLVQELRKELFTFLKYQTDAKDFREIAQKSGLINDNFPVNEFDTSYYIKGDKIIIKEYNHIERIAQILADFLRKKLLNSEAKFSFETVFSHRSKIDIIKTAQEQGYKVYLYFVSTNSPEINKARVKQRVANGGHDVPEDKIVSRYFRSLNLMFDASQFCYRAYFFDNSKEKPQLFASFKQKNLVEKNWDISNELVPDWFIKYYINKL